jgi:ribosomal protein S18 acetylase RimI-like enzyme
VSAPHADRTQIEIRLVDASAFASHLNHAADIYGRAMYRTRDLVAQRRDIMADHVDRVGFAAAVAMSDADLLGFGYGYQGRAGDWWHDVVATAMGREQATRWLSDAFELAELHVEPAHQGAGVGRQLLDTLLGATTSRTVVLSTHDQETVARSLYRSVGFIDLLREFRFPGSQEIYAVLGLHR